jgi:predicted TIM-barrel fold metal-dependent hydrolase
MSELFQDVASIDYPIIDADAHVNEPPDLWQSRVPSRLKHRAPKVLHTADGDVWSFNDGEKLRPLGLTATAGLSYLQFRAAGLRYDEIRPGSFDTRARLADLDADGIWAQVIYPSVTLAGAKTYADEPELQLACVRAYNEWLLEFCAGSNGRLVPQAIVPTTSVADAVAELRWAIDHGHKAGVVSTYPNGTLEPKPEDDAFWGLAADAEVPLVVHIGSFTNAGLGATVTQTTLGFLAAAGATKAGGDAIPVTSQLLFSGVFQSFPTIQFVLVESNIGWIPTALEQLDDMFLRYRWYTKAVDLVPMMPSRTFHTNFWATFMKDRIGVELRHHMNLDHIMWSTDYPHTGSEWPNSRCQIESLFRGVPGAEVKKLLHDNAKALYKLDGIPDRLSLASTSPASRMPSQDRNSAR